MKKIFRVLALVTVLTMMMSAVALAANTVVDGDKATVELIEGFGSAAEWKENGEKLDVTVTSNSLKASDNYYLVLVIKSADGENYEITEDNILYIDQIAAANGVVEFSVYPSAMKDSIILITGVTEAGTAGQVKAAIIKGKYVLGDVNDDGYINADDALLILRHAAGYITLTDNEVLAANAQNDAYINADDALLILRYAAGFIPGL